jgi:hypothetical protein
VEELSQDWRNAITYSVVTWNFGDRLTMKDVGTLGINVTAADANREVGWWEDVKEQFLLKGDEEEIIWPAMGLGTAGHGDDGIRGRCNEDF